MMTKQDINNDIQHFDCLKNKERGTIHRPLNKLKLQDMISYNKAYSLIPH